MEQLGDIPMFNIPETFGNIPWNFMGKFSEYSRNISWEYSTNNIPGTLLENIPPEFHRGLFLNILGIYLGIFHEYSMNNIPGTLFQNTPRNFIGNFFSIFWEYVMGMFHEYSTNIYLPVGIDLTSWKKST